MYEFLEYRVLDVMTREPKSLAPTATLSEAEAVFDAHDFNALPVVAPDGRLLGLLTKLDFLRAFRFNDDSMFPPYEKIMSSTVETVMTTDIEAVTPRLPLWRVLERMVKDKRRSYPVVEDHQLVAMIGREDVLGALRRASAGEAAEGPI